jgi:hypothetical protein
MNFFKSQLLIGECDTTEEAEMLKMLLTDSGGIYKFSKLNVHMHPVNGGPELSYGAVLLGTPIGSKPFILDFLQNKLVEVQSNALALLECRDHMQAQLLMLRKCLNSSVNHLLRTLPPDITVEHLANPFNVILKATMEKILEVELLPVQWSQMCLGLT